MRYNFLKKALIENLHAQVDDHGRTEAKIK